MKSRINNKQIASSLAMTQTDCFTVFAMTQQQTDCHDQRSRNDTNNKMTKTTKHTKPSSQSSLPHNRHCKSLLQGTKQTRRGKLKQSHDTNSHCEERSNLMKCSTNIKQIASAKKPRNDVPKLRFKEFEGEWEQKKLGDISKFSKGKNISKADIVEDGKLECIRYGELYTVYNEIIEDIKSKTNLDEANLILSQSNDVIIPASGETQIDIATASCVLKDGVALGGDLNIIKSKANGVFLSYYLNSKRKIDIARLSQGISVVHLYSSQLKTLNLNLPQDEEQQKIANFLTAVDTKLQQLSTKKETLEQYKKGVMQQLFSQQLRFKPDASQPSLRGTKQSATNENQTQFPDWEEKRLGEVFKINAGGDVQKENVSLIKDDIFKYPIYANSEKNKGFYGYSDLYKVDFDCVTVTGRGALGVANARTEKFYPIVRLLVLKPKKKSDVVFFENLINQMNIFPESTGVPQLTGPQFSIYKIKFPCYEEQQKIATYLSAIDKKIEAVQTQISNTQAFKKGLLQQMFV